MALDILNETTLSEAVTKDLNEFTVGSTTNITAGTSALVVQGTAGQEVMFVQTVPVSGRVTVLRGWNGTRALSHPNGARVFIAAPDAFKRDWGFTDRAGNVVNLVGDSGNYPSYALPGARARDGIGNEYVLVELTATAYAGTTVTISRDGNFTAVQTAGGTQGSVGVTVEAGTSDQYVWAQIYGRQDYAQIDAVSAGTSGYIAVPATSVSTPSVGLAVLAAATTAAAYVVHGMFLAGAVESDTTSATSATGNHIPVWLNYPYVLNRTESIETSNS